MTLADIRLTKEEILADYRLAYRSRQASYIGRREVLSGKAKFGIFGDGKELPQLAMAHAFQKGDFRSGYYRVSDLDVFSWIVDRSTVLRRTLCAYRYRSRPLHRRALYDRALQFPQPQSRRLVEKPDRPVQLFAHVPHRSPNAAAGGAGLRIQTLP